MKVRSNTVPTLAVSMFAVSTLRWRAFCLALLLLCSVSLQARETLYLPFENALSPALSSVDIAHVGVEQFRSGHQGQALQVGGVYGNLRIPLTGLFSAREGSVSMWVSPVDWQAKDNDFHVFFDARGNGALVLYKYFEGSRMLFLSTRDIDSDGNVVVGREIDWQLGQWKHLVATWSYQGIRLYINGKPIATMPTLAELPDSLAETIELGDLAWGRPRTTSSLMDEVRMFDHALTPLQVERLYHGHTGASMYSAFNEKSLSLTHDATSAKALQLSLEWSHDITSTPVSYVADITCADGSASSKISGTARSTLHQLSIPLPACASAGMFRISVTASDRHGNAISRELTVESITPTSLSVYGHSKLPLPPPSFEARASSGPVVRRSEITVPAPWAAPRIEGHEVAVWGRRYDFSQGVMAASVHSQTQALIPAPMQLVYGNTMLPSPSATPPSVNSAGEAVLATEIKISGNTEFLLTGSVAYDGLYHITMRVNNAVTLREDLRIQIPVAGAVLKRWHKYTGRALENTGALSPHGTSGLSTLLKSAYTPYLWIGDEQVGLMWYAESDRYWPRAQHDDAIQLLRTAEGAMLILDIASAGTVLPKNWQFEFGLMPTPVRPVAHGKGSRLRLAPLSDPDIDVLWPDNSERSYRYYGYPEAQNPALFSAELRQREQRGGVVAPYLCPTFLSTATPEWRAAGPQWSMKRFDATSSDVMVSGGALAMVSPRSTSWQNFFANKLEAFLMTHQPGALYFDNAQLYGAAAPEAGIGYPGTEGQKPEYPILAYRRLFQNIAAISDRHGAAVRILHGSGQLNPLIASSGTYLLNGEQYRGVVQDSYLDILSLEEFRQQFSSSLTGAAPLFIPEFDADRQAQVQPTQELMGLLLVHDVPLWPVWVNVTVVQQALDALERAAPKAGQFVRYDSAAVPATVSQHDILISAHINGEAAPLLIAFNTGNKVATDICMKNSMDAQPGRITDHLTGETFTRRDNGCYRVDFSRRGYRLLKASSMNTETENLRG